MGQELPADRPADSERASSRAAAGAIAGLAAGWIAAGSTGLMAHSLRHGLTWIALGAAIVAAWPRRSQAGLLARFALLSAAAGAAVFLIASPLPPLNVLAVSLVLTALARALSAEDAATVLCAARATFILAVYRLAYLSIPLVWYAADTLGWAMGSVAAFCTRQPLWVGATMGGVDYLPPMLYLACALSLRTARSAGVRPAFKRLSISVLVVLLGSLLYLLLLTFAGGCLELAEFLASAGERHGLAASSFAGPYVAALAKLAPWNVPALAAVIQCAIAWGLFRWLPPKETADVVPPDAISGPFSSPLFRAVRLATVSTSVACLAAAIPAATVLCQSQPDLADKKVVFFEKGFLNWLKPEHGQYGRSWVGMYGLLPTFVESLGARAVRSPDLSENDLADADALVVIYPDKPWKPEQLERIEAFVRKGGSLMVMGEHTVREKDGGSRINDVLAPTAMRVPFDSAVFAIGGWLHSYDALAHPTSTGISDEANQFGVVIGASVEARWPARPLLVGRWGWADLGDASKGDASKGESMLGNERYDPGEKLGDVILAAEQPLGAGKVICFGDPSMLTNSLTVCCHDYTSRLFAYLLGGGCTPQATWRQFTGLAAIALLLVHLLRQHGAAQLAAAALSLAASLAVCTAATHRLWDILPDGLWISPNNLAYIDAGHLNADSPESRREDGLGALHMTLIRNGYLPLQLWEITPERLDKARLFFVDAPAREYTAAECRVVKDFVRRGGILIVTVGWERAGPSRRLLSELGFHVGAREDADTAVEKPRPLGHFKSPFFNGGDYFNFVRFHAAWPVYCDDPKALVVTEYESGKPVIIVRRLRHGAVAVIGDTCFAMMKNLENEDGSPIEGMRENAVFWRWFLALLGDKEPWYPPKPQIEAPAADAAPAAAPPASAPSPATTPRLEQ
jgi:hypothetical protein